MRCFLYNALCEKSIAEEVQFYFKSYQEFVTSDNQKLKAVISALNAANVGHYKDLRIKYPGFILEPPVVDINKLVSVIRSVYPVQVLQYSLGGTKKEEPAASNTAINEDINNVGLFPHKGKDHVGLFPKNSIPKNKSHKSNEYLGNLDMDQSVEEINEEISEHGSYQPPDRVSTIEVGQDCQKIVHKGIDTGMMSLIGDTGMIIMLTGQIVVIAVN